LQASSQSSRPEIQPVNAKANDLVRKIHDRMPATIEAANHQRWFDGFDDLLVPYPAKKMSVIPA
jgi:putative SOS response-associated peptidase YedK